MAASRLLQARALVVSFLLPGEGRGPVGMAEVAKRSGRQCTSPNWTPAFAAEQ